MEGAFGVDLTESREWLSCPLVAPNGIGLVGVAIFHGFCGGSLAFF